MTFEGPDPALWDRYSVATNAPVIMGMELDELVAMNDRVVAARTWDGLSEEDRELIELAELQVSAGMSPTLQHPDSYAHLSDWTKEDEALGLEPGEPRDGGSQGKSLPDPNAADWIGL